MGYVSAGYICILLYIQMWYIIISRRNFLLLLVDIKFILSENTSLKSESFPQPWIGRNKDFDLSKLWDRSMIRCQRFW